MDIDNIASALPQMLERKFVGYPPAQLRAACKHLNIDARRTDSSDTLVRRLLEAYNLWDGDATDGRSAPAEAPAAEARAEAMIDLEKRLRRGPDIPIATVVQPIGSLGRSAVTKDLARKLAPGLDSSRRPPDLRNILSWGGRKYRVRVLPQSQDAGGVRKIPLAWEGQVFYADPREAFQDMPAPIFYNLLDAKSSKLNLGWDWTKKEMVRTWTEFAVYPFQFFGITPGTENLCEDLREWYQRDAIEHELYANEGKDYLERVWRTLTDGMHPTERDMDRNHAYWRYEILQLLGLTAEQLESAAA